MGDGEGEGKGGGSYGCEGLGEFGDFMDCPCRKCLLEILFGWGPN